MSKKETISLKDLGVADTIPAPVKEEKPKKEVAKVEVKTEAKAPVVEEENEYGLDLSDDEEDQFKEWMLSSVDIQNKIKELDAEII